MTETETQDRAAYVAAVLAHVGLIPRGTRHVKHQRHRRTSTRCSGCGRPRDRGPQQRYCRRCHAEHMRAKRPKHSELSPAARARANCRRATNMLVARGALVKTACDCGATDVTAEHIDDYTDPRAVIWRCRVCRRGPRPAVADAA